MFDQSWKIIWSPTARLGAQVLSRESWRNAPFEALRSSVAIVSARRRGPWARVRMPYRLQADGAALGPKPTGEVGSFMSLM